MSAYRMKVYNVNARKNICGLHACLRHAMRLGRWAGYFPVQGLNQLTADGTRFKYKSIYSVYHFFTIIGQVVMSCFSLLWFFQSDVTLTSISNVVFYVTGLISAFLFVRLAQQWQNLMKKAAETEQSLTKLRLDSRVVRKTSIIAYVIMALALVEHILCTSFNVKIVMKCLEEDEITTRVMTNYVMYRMPYVFNYIPYNAFNAALSEFICIQATFIWSFTDVLAICFSIYITAYFNSLNKIISSKKNNNIITWSLLRQHYSKIVVLVKEIDVQLSSFILLSFFTDLFFICLQLFNSLHRNYASFCDDSKTSDVLSSPDYLLYYVYSFLFLVLRTLSLSLFAANVHTAAQEPILAVYDVPAPEYDQEVQRFQLQLRFTKIALSGKFFYVTRNMVLQVLGTIITYELVLLQFSVNKEQFILTTAFTNYTTNGTFMTTTEVYTV